MVLAPDLVEAVAQHIEEVVVGVEDMPLEIELDHALGAPDRIDLPLHVRIPHETVVEAFQADGVAAS